MRPIVADRWADAALSLLQSTGCSSRLKRRDESGNSGANDRSERTVDTGWLSVSRTGQNRAERPSSERRELN